ncbi:MAG: hypothetical protein JWR12_3088 [Mucilaginibacter sp.]|nr:hypothetical protein [Mucilaginibacter sp.]
MAATYPIPEFENTIKLQKIAAKYFEHAEIEEMREKNGVKINVYFDTFYIFSMIQGYWELQVGKLKTDDEKFADDAFLVKAMAFLGYIDNIKIFLPHVAELSEQLKKSYLLPSDEITENEIDAFLEEIKLQKLQDLKELAAQNKLKQYLDRMAPNADTILKANYILSELYWNKRSNRLFYGEDGKLPVISYDSQQFNPIPIIQSGLFKKIEAAISSGGRSALTINNFRDAVALCMFKEKIPDKKDNPVELSLFYVSHDVYSRLTEDILKEFSYTPKKGRRITLIKDAEYFIIDAIFKQEKNAGREANDAFDKIRDIKKSFDLYRDLDVPFPSYDIKPLIDKWNKYRNYEFFQRIWDDEKGGIVPLNEHITKLFDHKFLTENDNKFSPMLERDVRVSKMLLVFRQKILDF